MLFFIISPELLPLSVVQGYKQNVPNGTKNTEGIVLIVTYDGNYRIKIESR